MRITKCLRTEIQDNVIDMVLSTEIASLERLRGEVDEAIYHEIVPAEIEASLRELPVEYVAYIKELTVCGHTAQYAKPMPVPVHKSLEGHKGIEELVTSFKETEADLLASKEAIINSLQLHVFSLCNTTDQLIAHWHGVVEYTDFYEDVLNRSNEIESALFINNG